MERLSAPERTREELRALMNGELGTAAGRGEFVGFREGGSGSLVVEVMRRAVGAASDDLRLSGV